MKHKNRQGFEFLESDTEIYNLLVTKQQEGNEILELYNIQLINDNYTDRDTEEVNTIYIIRDEMTANTNTSTFETEGYTVRIQIVISCSQYDTIKANALLKTTIKVINQLIKLESISAYCKINRITPRYQEPGRLSEYRLELYTYELNEIELYTPHEYMVNLLVHADIMNHDKVALNKIYPVMPHNKLLNTNYDYKRKYNKRYEDDDGFVGG